MTLWPFSNCISMYSDYKKEEEILHKSEQENPKNTYHNFKKNSIILYLHFHTP